MRMSVPLTWEKYIGKNEMQIMISGQLDGVRLGPGEVKELSLATWVANV